MENNKQQMEQVNEQVQMMPNRKDASWEVIPYKWDAAVRSLGHAYDLRLVNTDTKEVIKERAKVTNPAIEKPASVSATKSNPNVEFELWWQENGQTDTDIKEHERNAFLAGWFGRQNAARR